MLDVWASIDELSEWKRALSLTYVVSHRATVTLLDVDRDSDIQPSTSL